VNKKKWQEEIEARDKDIRQKMDEQFGIHNFINKEKEHANRWANQHQTDWLKDQDPNAKGKLAIAIEELKEYISNLRKRGIDI
jgi:hypothetical protein